jgi:hypothetical protein
LVTGGGERVVDDHWTEAELDGVVVRPEEHRRRLATESFLRARTATKEGARAGDVAVDSGSKGVEDVEEKVGLLSTGSDGDERR